MLHTARSISAVRVGKHEQITRLLIAARSEEVSTLRLPARLETLRQAPAWKEQRLPCTFSYSMSKCVCVRSGVLSRQLFLCFCARVRLASRQTNSCHAKNINALFNSSLSEWNCSCAKPFGVAAAGTQHLTPLLSYYSAHFETYCQELSCSSVRPTQWVGLHSSFLFFFFFLTRGKKNKKDALFLSSSFPKKPAPPNRSYVYCMWSAFNAH